MSRIGIAALLSLLAVPGLVSAQSVTAGAPEYRAPLKPVVPGQAPGMKVQLIENANGQKQYAVIFYEGDEPLSGLTDFAKQYGVTSAHFTAIGAVTDVTLAWFDPARKMYKAMPFTGQMEVAAMSGDIAIYDGKPMVHAHAVVGLPDGSTRGGHLLEMHVRPTLEVMVTVDPKGMQKRFDPKTDTTLIDPAMHP